MCLDIDEDKLLPCPFCGAKAVFGGMDFEPGDVEKVECSQGCVVQTYKDTKKGATRRWNRRVIIRKAEHGKARA